VQFGFNKLKTHHFIIRCRLGVYVILTPRHIILTYNGDIAYSKDAEFAEV